MPERTIQANPGNARKFTIPADSGQTAFDIILPNNKTPGNYKVVKKDIPSTAQGKMFKKKKVKWINNFGIRLSKVSNNPFIEEVPGEAFDYEVVVPGPAPAGFSTLVYFDGAKPVDALATIDGNGNYHVTLNIGDPAMGWGGGGGG